jgi:hypothetical protein
LVIVALLAVAGPAQGDAGEGVVLESRFKDARIVVSSDRATTAIIDPMRVSISVETLAGLAVALPSGEAMAQFRVVGEDEDGPFWAGDGFQRWERHYVLMARAAGPQTIPSLPVLVEDTADWNQVACIEMGGCGNAHMPGTGGMRRLRTRPLTVSVTSVLPADADTARPKDAAPPLPLARPPSLPASTLTALAALAGAALLAGLWWRFRHARRGAPTVMRPAHELALAALRRLQGRRSEGAPVEDFTLVSAILRRYLGWRFDLSATARTTEEIVDAARARGGRLARLRRALGAVLWQCDLVKFARHRPVPAETRSGLEAAIAFVEETADGSVMVPVEGEAW